MFGDGMISMGKAIKNKVWFLMIIMCVFLLFGTNIALADGPTWSDKDAWDVVNYALTFSAPALADLDNDGDYDLLLGYIEDTCYAYNNTGSKYSPTWTRKSAWDLAISISGAIWTPALADLDNDGDYDLLLGNDVDDRCYGYKNTGSATSPSWTREISWDWTLEVGTGVIGNRVDPTLANLDNDNDYDLLIGDSSGKCYGYENTGTVNSPTWARKSAWDVQDIGDYACPAFADLDKDNDYDLLIGAGNGICYCYENTGTVTSPTWTQNSAWDAPTMGYYAQPALADLDFDGDNDLLIGGLSGGCYGYQNTDPTPPIPELPTLLLLGVGLITMIGVITYKRKTK
jgi:hypothetical protein